MTTNPNQRLPEIETLLQNPDTWRHYCALAAQLSPGLQTEALAAAERALNALKTNTVTAPLPVCWQAMFGVVMSHVGYQTPLYFSDAVATEWGNSKDGAASLCPIDGYRAPVSMSTCPVCEAKLATLPQCEPMNVEFALEDDLNKAIQKHAPAFWIALRQLAGQLGNLRRAWLIGWIGANENRSTIDLMGMPIPAMLALLHVTAGTPLYLTDGLMDAWARWDKKEDVAECSMCGYRMPPKYPLCVLCGSETGEPGVWTVSPAREERRGSFAIQ